MSFPVLLVDDNEDDVFAFQRALKKAGLPPPLRVVSDGEAAMDYFVQAASGADPARFPVPDLVFLDLKLPYRDGLEVLEWIRTQPPLAAVAVVVLSGSDEPRDRQRADVLGARGYLVKPAKPEDLRRAFNLVVAPDAQR